METLSVFGHAVAAQLRAEKAAQQLSLGDLGERSGIPKVTLQRYLAGDRDVPTTRLDQIARALGVPIGTIVTQAEQRTARHT